MSSWVDHPLHCSCVECGARDPRYAGRRGTARSVIERLAWRGVSFRLVDGKVRFRPTTLLTEAERSEIRRVKDEVYQLLREDEGRRRRGEGNVRDEGEVFEMARRSVILIHRSAWNRNSRKFKSSILHSPARIGLKPRPSAFTSCIQGVYQAVTCMILRRDE